MPGLLDYLAGLGGDAGSAYGNALQQIAPLIGQFGGGGGSTAQNLIAALSADPDGGRGAAAAAAAQPNGIAANPQIVQIDPTEAARAAAQNSPAPTLPPPIAAARPASNGASPNNLPPINIAPATGQPDVSVGDQGGSSNASQSGGGDLFSALAPAAADASNSPEKSKTLLQTLGSTVSGIGDKLTNLSPSASQALLASGLTILAGNDGSRNLPQLLGTGGIAGLNTYNSSRAQIAQNQLAQQKNAIDARKELFAETQPVTVAPGNSLYSRNLNGSYSSVVEGQPQVARTVDMQGPDGKTYTVQLNSAGAPVGQPLLKSDPFAGPATPEQTTTINSAQTAAQTARTQYQNTAYLANQLASAPEFASGAGASINDFATRITGNKDAGQQLRGQLAQFANSSILSELPPGAASDKDIALVRNGVPPDNANKTTWQSYLAAVGRVQQVAAITSQAKADYLTANRGSLGPLVRPATINGVQYPAGASFTDVTAGGGQQQQSQQQPAQQAGSPKYALSAIDAAIARKRGQQ